MQKLKMTIINLVSLASLLLLSPLSYSISLECELPPNNWDSTYSDECIKALAVIQQIDLQNLIFYIAVVFAGFIGYRQGFSTAQ